jgi:ATP-dependent DNA helicase RecG
MTNGEVRALLRRLDGEPADSLETETLECKGWDATPAARDRCFRELREAVVCLANARGGLILLGIADRKRTRQDAIHGVGRLDVDEVRRNIYSGTDPPILVEASELIEPEGRLLVVRVPRGIPPHTTTDGVGKIRVGKDCRPLTGSSVSRMLFAGGQRDLSAELLPDASLADLDPDQIKRLAQAIEAEGGKPELARLAPEELLANLGLVRHGEVTLAAVLLLGRSAALARWAPQHEVVFMRFRSQTRYDIRHDFRGPLLSVLDRLEGLFESQVRIVTAEAGGFGEMQVPDLTWWAAREAVLNAMVHRDYFLHQSVQIEVHRDRVTIVSPGGFIGGVTPANVLRHPPVRRNSLLADVLQTVGFVNRAGLGVDRIYEEMLRLGKASPRYEGDESHVRLSVFIRTLLPFARFVAEETRAGRKLDLDDLILLRGLTDRGSLDRWSAADALQLTEEDAAERLVSLRERGYLTPQGRGRGTAYRLQRRFSDLLRGTAETDRDMPLEGEAVRLRIQAVLAERGRLTNTDIRRISGYSRREVLRLVVELRKQGVLELEGRGRGAHYRPGPKLPAAKTAPAKGRK